MPPSADILLTGLPRSGTTLACHLLNHLPDAVALFEPPSFFDVIRPTVPDSLGQIRKVFERQRTLIENTGTAESLSLNGKVPDNHLSYRASIENQRQNLLDGSSIRVDNLQPGTDYALIIKHPIIICSLLPEAAKEYPVFAIVRDPLSTLVSWCFTPFPVSQGRAGISSAGILSLPFTSRNSTTASVARRRCCAGCSPLTRRRYRDRTSFATKR